MQRVVMIAAAAALCALSAQGQSARPRRAEDRNRTVQFPCNTAVWQSEFAVGAARYDRSAATLSWELTTRRDLQPIRYEAFVADADGVEIAVYSVKLEPAKPEYAADEKVRAIVRVPRAPDGPEPGKVIVRKAR
jgi:hypothetical protein